MRSAHLLLFRLSYEILNSIFGKIKGDVKVLPNDLEVFRIRDGENYFDTSLMILSSKEFPLVQEGEIVKEGIIDFNKGVITFKQKD